MTSLTVFCGTELTSNADADLLVRAATSVQRQTRPTLMWICEHHTDTVDEPRLTAQLATALPANSRHIKSRSTKSMFEHYRVLIDKYVEAHPTCLTTEVYSHWITFVDGDDVIRPGRVQTFSEATEWHRGSWAPHQRASWMAPSAVGAARARDILRICHSLHMQSSYWEWCVTARLLHFFMQRIGPAALHHPSADLAFIALLYGPYRDSSGHFIGDLLRTELPCPADRAYIDHANPPMLHSSSALNIMLYTVLGTTAMFKEQSSWRQMLHSYCVDVHSERGGGLMASSEVERRISDVLASMAEAVTEFSRSPAMGDYMQHIGAVET